MNLALRRRSILPGFGLSLGFTVSYLSLVVLIPLGGLILKSTSLTWAQFRETVSDPRVVSAYRLSFGASLIAASVNVVFGLILAWVLVRYRFPGRRLVDALVDLPFALPTAVAGIALTTLYRQEGWLGRYFDWLGIEVAYAPLGVVVALTFISLPFVVRTLQPVLEDLDPEVEEAAASLGSGRLQTIHKVILPELWPVLLAGFALAFARALGEYGSIVFISANIPFRTQIVPLLMMEKLEQYKYAEATAIAVIMLAASFVLLLLINLLQWWSGQRHTAART